MDHSWGRRVGSTVPWRLHARQWPAVQNALLISPGFTRSVRDVIGPDVGLALRVSLTAGLAPEATQETPVATVDSALAHGRRRGGCVDFLWTWRRDLGIALPGPTDRSVQSVFAMPVVAEMMPPNDKLYDIDAIAHATRIGWEAGADVVKTMFSGHVEEFRDMAEGVPVPIIVAGGPCKAEGNGTLLEELQKALEAGAAGVAYGRRVWVRQTRKD